MVESARKDMRWVRLRHESSCEQCGSNVERFVGLMRDGRRAAEVTFCSVCCPEVKRVVDIARDRRIRRRRARKGQGLALAS